MRQSKNKKYNVNGFKALKEARGKNKQSFGKSEQLKNKKKSVEELVGFITNLGVDKLIVLSINKKKKEKEK